MLIRPSVSSNGWPPLPLGLTELYLLNLAFLQAAATSHYAKPEDIGSLQRFFIPRPVHPSTPTQSHALSLGCSAQAREEIRPLDTLVGQRRSRLPVNCGTLVPDCPLTSMASLIDPPRSSTPARATWTRRVCTRYDELGGRYLPSSSY